MLSPSYGNMGTNVDISPDAHNAAVAMDEKK